MSDAALGQVIITSLIMFVFALILLGLLALIPPLRQAYVLRNVLAWFLGSVAVAYFTRRGGANIWTVGLDSLICAGLLYVRHWYAMGKLRKPAEGDKHD